MIEKILEWLMTFALWFQMAVLGVVLLIVLLVVANVLFKDISFGKFRVVSAERKKVRRSRRRSLK